MAQNTTADSRDLEAREITRACNELEMRLGSTIEASLYQSLGLVLRAAEQRATALRTEQQYISEFDALIERPKEVAK
jgi:hypothetical protein